MSCRWPTCPPSPAASPSASASRSSPSSRKPQRSSARRSRSLRSMPPQTVRERCSTGSGSCCQRARIPHPRRRPRRTRGRGPRAARAVRVASYSRRVAGRTVVAPRSDSRAVVTRSRGPRNRQTVPASARAAREIAGAVLIRVVSPGTTQQQLRRPHRRRPRLPDSTAPQQQREHRFNNPPSE